jgi:histidinol-phosphatase (PHP family)
MNNYHTHTSRCKHSSGDVGDYVAEARLAGLGELGFSDHVPLPDGRWPENRMYMEELPGYVGAFARALSAEEARPTASGRIRLFLGLECEWASEYEAYFRDELVGRLGVEYLVSGAHFYPMGGEWLNAAAIDSAAGLVAYASHFERSLASGLFAFVAHPDLFCMGYLGWDAEARACARDVLAAIKASGLPVEINGYGMRKPRVPGPDGPRWPYPRAEFWDLAAAYDLDVLLSSDAHRPVDVGASLEQGRAFASDRGLRIVDSLAMPCRRACCR